METHPGEGVLKEEKFPHSRKPSHWWVCVEFWNLRRQHNITGWVCVEFWNLRRQHNITGRKKKKERKTTEYKPNRNCGKENFPAKGYFNYVMCSLTCSHNKSLSEYQRRARRLHTSPSPPRVRDVGLGQPELEGKRVLQSQSQRWHLPPNCEQAPSC